MKVRFNGLKGILETPVLSTDTSFEFISPLTHSGGVVLSLNANDTFLMSVIVNGSMQEIVEVIAYNNASRTATVRRGIEGTIPQDYPEGTLVGHTVVASDFEGIPNEPPMPTNALPMTDEFNSTTLDPKWIWYNRATSTATLSGRALTIATSQTGESVVGIVQDVSTLDSFDVITKVDASAITGRYRPAGILVANGLTSGTYRNGGLSDRCAEVLHSSGPNNVSSNLIYWGPSTIFAYYRATYVRSTGALKMYVSLNGNTWEQMISVTDTNVSYVGLGQGCYSQPAPYSNPRTYQWFRQLA